MFILIPRMLVLHYCKRNRQTQINEFDGENAIVWFVLKMLNLDALRYFHFCFAHFSFWDACSRNTLDFMYTHSLYDLCSIV